MEHPSIATFKIAVYSSLISLGLVQGLICPENCLCDEMSTLSVESMNKYNIMKSINSTDQEEISLLVTAIGVLRKFHRDYNLRFMGNVVVCSRTNFTAIPSFHAKKKPKIIGISSKKVQVSVSALIMQCGQLIEIKSEDLPESVFAADFSSNRIRFVSQDVLTKASALKIINLQNNLITRIFHPIDDPKVVPKRRNFPIVLLEGNPLICSCELYITTNGRLGKEKSICDLVDEKAKTRENLSQQLNQLHFVVQGSPMPVPLKFFRHISAQIANFCFHPDTSFTKFIESHNKELKEFYKYEDYFQGKVIENRIGTSREYTVDYPLLVTMAAWFLMVFVGLCKFVRSNAIEYEMHKNYLSKLDEQQNEVVGAINPGRRHSKKSMTETAEKNNSQLIDRTKFGGETRIENDEGERNSTT